MFGAPFSNLKEHPKPAERASEAFSLLKGAIRATQENADENELTMEALFAWSTVHGHASITLIDIFSMLAIQAAKRQDETIQHIMTHLCRAINCANIPVS